MEEKNVRTHSIFEDPAIADAAKDDPIVGFISRHWKTVIGSLVAVALSMVAYDRFKDTAEHKRAVATERLLDIQQSYRAIIQRQTQIASLKRELAAEGDITKKEGIQQTVDTNTKELNQLRERTTLAIESLSSPKPFDALAQLYRGLVAARFEDYETTRSILTASSWEQVGASNSAERMAAEFAVVGLAKALVDSRDSVALAREALMKVASKGDFAAVQAALALAAVASTTEEQQQVQSIIDELSKRFPTQEKFLSSARERIGM